MLLVIRYLGIHVYVATSRVFVWVLLASNSNIDKHEHELNTKYQPIRAIVMSSNICACPTFTPAKPLQLTCTMWT